MFSVNFQHGCILGVDDTRVLPTDQNTKNAVLLCCGRKEISMISAFLKP